MSESPTKESRRGWTGDPAISSEVKLVGIHYQTSIQLPENGISPCVSGCLSSCFNVCSFVFSHFVQSPLYACLLLACTINASHYNRVVFFFDSLFTGHILS